jgi:hypothetical protein
MKSNVIITTLFCLMLLVAVSADAATVAQLTHSQFQAVNSTGGLTYNATNKVILEGILLNNPADMLDPKPDETITQTYNLGAQWQFFFQGEGTDHAGTAVYMAQLYNNLPWITTGGYSNQAFIAEMTRLNAAKFSVGDRIKVTGYYLGYKGKNNINEQHLINPEYNFTIEMVTKGAGLPKPELVTLSQLKDAGDNFIFDSTRQTGCEYYQGRLIKIKNAYFADPNYARQNWGPNAELLITDANAVKTFTVKLGRGNGIYAGSNNLTEPFDVIGIMDQESSSTNSMIGYRLWVVSYDGNGSVLASREHRQADIPSDINLDGMADINDMVKFIEDWLGYQPQ